MVLCREGKEKEAERGEILGCSGHWSEAAEESVCGWLRRGICRKVKFVRITVVLLLRCVVSRGGSGRWVVSGSA